MLDSDEQVWAYLASGLTTYLYGMLTFVNRMNVL